MSDDRRARAALSRVVEPGDKRVATVLKELGAVAALDRVVAGHGSMARFAERVRRLDVDRDLATAEKVGARLVVPGDSEWPRGLDDLAEPPWCLWLRGPRDLAEASERSVAVVGSRLCTAYGEQAAADLAGGLAQRGWTVFSGAAYGIDGAAHRGALAVDGLTVAALAGGVDRAYPSGHARLLQRIVESGVVLSEMAPGSAPMRSRFLKRNRIIAAATQATVVVEADLRSGSLNTMRTAYDLGRQVGAFPGPVTSMASNGCHERIRENQAVLVTGVDDVIELVGRMGADAVEPPRGPVVPTDSLGPDEARVHEVLPLRGWADLSDVVRMSAIAPMVALGALGRLVDAGLAQTAEGRWRKARATRS